MERPDLEYLALLVRIWHDRAQAPDQRALAREALIEVEFIPNGEKHYFASLEEMVAYLRAHWLGAT